MPEEHDMSKYVSKVWVSVAAILTVILIAYLFPIMRAKYGLATAILSSLVLVFGMALYYLRGVLMANTGSHKSHASKNEGESDTSSP